MELHSQSSRRLIAYTLTAAFLVIIFFFSRNLQWSGSTELHTLMEAMATLLALITGCLALIRYYSKQDRTFLLVGAAFIGTAFLDGYHASVSSNFFSEYMPSASPSLIPWSWLASRIFISLMLFLSWLTWRTRDRHADHAWGKERFVYGITAGFTAACFLFFVLMPLPSGYREGSFIHRPAEFLPALFFLVTLGGYLHKGDWARNVFDHCLVISLIINLGVQLLFMPGSAALFDLKFDVAHLLKFAAYLTVMTGLLINIYRVFKEEARLMEKLGESEAKHRTITESSHDAIIRYDRDHQFTYLNPAAALSHGCDADSFIGMKPKDLSLPQDLCRSLEAALDEVFASGKPHSLNYETGTANGFVTMDWKAYPEFSADGSVESVISVSRDISAFKQREEASTRLLKLESIGLMAGGIAHDFNNILAGLFGNISLAKSCLPAAHESHQHLERAEQAFKRATNLTKQFLTFSDGGKPVKALVQLDKVVEEVLQFNLANTSTTAVISRGKDLWPIFADEGLIAQVLANLVINASQSMDEGGQVFVRMENAVVSQSETEHDDARKFVRLVMRDEGCGIEPEHLGKIFDPYFSTKNTGRGLGLATVYSIIRQHQGNIYVRSVAGAGTSFTLLLPAAEYQAEPVTLPEQSSPVATQAHILLMDDEKMVLDVSASILAKLGHRVDVAKDGAEAISKYRQALAAGSPYDFLIMDLTVPNGMGGQEAMRHILALNPGARALVSSGYAIDSVMANHADYGFCGVIPKPFTMSSIKAAVDGLLAGTG